MHVIEHYLHPLVWNIPPSETYQLRKAVLDLYLRHFFLENIVLGAMTIVTWAFWEETEETEIFYCINDFWSQKNFIISRRLKCWVLVITYSIFPCYTISSMIYLTPTKGMNTWFLQYSWTHCLFCVLLSGNFYCSYKMSNISSIFHSLSGTQHTVHQTLFYTCISHFH